MNFDKNTHLHLNTIHEDDKEIRILEYRLNDASENYPAIYHFAPEHGIDEMEIFCRRQCAYFVFEGKVYNQVSTAFENDMYVFYLETDGEEFPFTEAAIHRPLGMEVRLYNEDNESKELTFIPCNSHKKVFRYIGNSFNYFSNLEYETISAEMDQDRRVYVLYVKPTGVQLV